MSCAEVALATRRRISHAEVLKPPVCDRPRSTASGGEDARAIDRKRLHAMIVDDRGCKRGEP
jgi:hypothetical protein